MGREGCINRKDIFTGCVVPGTGRLGAKQAPFPLCWHFLCCTLERPQRVNGNSCQTASFCSHNKAPGNPSAGRGEQGDWLCPSLPQLTFHRSNGLCFQGTPHRRKPTFLMFPLTHDPERISPWHLQPPLRLPGLLCELHTDGAPAETKQFLGKKEQNTFRQFLLELGTGTRQLCIQIAWRVRLLTLKRILSEAVPLGVHKPARRSTVPHGEHRWGSGNQAS